MAQRSSPGSQRTHGAGADCGRDERFPANRPAALRVTSGPAADGIITTMHYSDSLDTPRNKQFRTAYATQFKMQPDVYAVQGYDAGAIVGLAIAQAGKPDAAAIQDAMRKVLDPSGTVIHAGKDEFAKALQLIKDGKPIKYEGVIGAVQFDQYGDIAGPFRLWKITGGQVTTVGTMSAADVDAIKVKMGN